MADLTAARLTKQLPAQGRVLCVFLDRPTVLSSMWQGPEDETWEKRVCVRLQPNVSLDQLVFKATSIYSQEKNHSKQCVTQWWKERTAITHFFAFFPPSILRTSTAFQILM